MIKVNEYFNGNVKSLALVNTEGTATVGVMEPGEYEFGTSQKEFMTVVSGELIVKLPDATDWKSFKKNETFIVEPNKKFQLKVKEPTAYLCIYK